MDTKVKIDYAKLDKGHRLLKSLFTKFAPIILQTIGSDQISVTDIMIKVRQKRGFAMVQPEVSRNLMTLRKYDLVTVIRSGKHKLYSVNFDAIENAIRISSILAEQTKNSH